MGVRRCSRVVLKSMQFGVVDKFGVVDNIRGPANIRGHRGRLYSTMAGHTH